MSFTTTSSSFASAGPSAYSTRASSFSTTTDGDEVVPRNRGPFPAPIQRPKHLPKTNLGLGLGLPTDVLTSSFREPSEIPHHSFSSSEVPAAPTVEYPTKAELRALRVAALRGIGVFLDENPRPTTTTTTTTISSNILSPKPSPPLLPTRRPSPARLQAQRLAKAEDDEILNPTFFTHSPLPMGPTAPPSTPAYYDEAPDASTLPVPFPLPHAGCAKVKGKEVILIQNYTSSPSPGENHIVECVASPDTTCFVFQPFSPVEEEYYLPRNLLVTPNVDSGSEYFSLDTIYETS